MYDIDRVNDLMEGIKKWYFREQLSIKYEFKQNIIGGKDDVGIKEFCNVMQKVMKYTQV